MTKTILQFPVSDEAFRRSLRRWNAWNDLAEAAAETYAGWLFGLPLPDWVLGAWRGYTNSLYNLGGWHADAVNWSDHWCAFVNSNLACDPRWTEAVEAKLREAEDDRTG